MVDSLNKATHLAKDHLIYDNVIVSVNGDVYANCDIDAVCATLETAGEDFFIVKGQRKIVVTKKAAQVADETKA